MVWFLFEFCENFNLHSERLSLKLKVGLWGFNFVPFKRVSGGGFFN